MDYRDVEESGFDAISSIGLTEHIGVKNYPSYFAWIRDHLKPQGRLLNHCITRPHNRRRDIGAFIDRYVFPDGELIGSGTIITAVQNVGLEVQHEENLRVHYAMTLAGWCRNLVENWDACVAEVGEGTARVWGLYMAGSRLGFERNEIQLHHVLATKTDADGAAATRCGTPSESTLADLATVTSIRRWCVREHAGPAVRRGGAAPRAALGPPGAAGARRPGPGGLREHRHPRRVGRAGRARASSRAATTRCARGRRRADARRRRARRRPGHRVGGARRRRRHRHDHRAEGLVRDARRRRLAAAGRRPDRDAGDGPDRREVDGADPDLGRGARRPRRRTCRAGADVTWLDAAGRRSERARRGRRVDRLARRARATSGWPASRRRCARSAST